MTTRTDYTQQEWALLAEAPMLVGLGMIATSRSGLMGTVREILAYRSCLRRETALAIERLDQPNHLIIAVLDEQPARHRVLTAPLFSSGDPVPLLSAVLTARLRMVDHCAKIADVLADRTPYAEAQEFKRWLMWIAHRVAQAGGGGWLGSGTMVSEPEEERMLDCLAVSLRIGSIVDADTSPTRATLLDL